MPKRSIRQKLLMQRRMLDVSTCLQRSLLAQQNLLATAEYQRASVVALYSSIRNEVLTDGLFSKARHEGKDVCYPRVVGDTLEFVIVSDPGDLAKGAFGIKEPTANQVLAPAEIDLAVVPGVGFDRSGYRLGYGGGYYDRAISLGRPRFLMGLAYDLQLVDELPAEDHDIRLDLIVTESEVLAFSNNRN